MKVNWLKRIFRYLGSIGRQKDAALYEAMSEDFKQRKSKPVVIGVDLAKSEDKTGNYSAPARRHGKTAQQEFRERGVANMAAARRGELTAPPKPQPERLVAASPAISRSYSSQNTVNVNNSSNLYAAAAVFAAYELGSSDSSSSDSSCDSGSSDSGSCGCD